MSDTASNASAPRDVVGNMGLNAHENEVEQCVEQQAAVPLSGADQRLITAIVGAMQQLQPAGQAATLPSIAANFERSLTWSDLKLYPGACDRADAWFVSFEQKLKARRVNEDSWGEKFIECPKVGDELKRTIGEAGHTEYKAIRLFCLDRDGPLDPVGYFRHEIHKTKGTNRKDVCEKLTDLLALHNRAARDAGKEVWSERDLIYPFIAAFPQTVAKHIRGGLKIALMQPNPFLILVHRAPEAEEQPSAETLPLINSVQPEVVADKKRVREDDQLIAAIQDLQRDVRSSRLAVARAPAQDCNRCGGSAHAIGSCPALNKTCRVCQKMGHFAVCCRARQPMNSRTNAARAFEQPRPHGRFAPRPFRQGPVFHNTGQ